MVKPNRKATACKYCKSRNTNPKNPRHSRILFTGANVVLSPLWRFIPTKFPSKSTRGHPIQAWHKIEVVMKKVA